MAILAVAAGLRLFRLDTFPPGLYSDVAQNGLDSLQHGFQLLYQRGAGNGIEGMIVWLDAVSLWLNGIRPIALYLTTVVIGLLTLLVHFALADRIFGRRVALLSVALLAVSFWHVHFSRIGYRTLLMPLFLELVFYTLIWAYRSGGLWRWTVAGVVLGLGAYTYTSYRVLALVLAGAGLIWVRQRRPLPARREIVAYVAAGAVTAAPLLTAIALHPDTLDRGFGVSVFGGSPLELPFRLGQHLLLTLPMFNLWGDPEMQYDVPHLPLFDPLVGIAFLYGLKLAWGRRRQLEYGFLLIWLLVFTLVVFLSDRTPHFLRASGLVPAAYLLAGIGLAAVIDRVPRALGRALAATVLALSLAWTATFYFVVYPHVHGLYQEFLGDRVDLGRFLDNSSWDGRTLYVSLTYSSRGVVTTDTFRSIPISFATAGKTSWTFLPFTAIGELPPDARLATVFDPKDRVTLPALTQRYPQGRIVYTLSLHERQWAVFVSDPADPFQPGTVPSYSNW
jgi:hypothetical protein